MSTFADGPAAGVRLNFRRTPVFLRVTDNGVNYDVLDQPDDAAKASERLYCYVLKGEPLRGFIDGANYSGPFAFGTYVFYQPQPTDEIMRSNRAWREWVEKQPRPSWMPSET